MNRISIDIESRSSVDLQKCGMYRYAENPDFDILLFGYAVDSGDSGGGSGGGGGSGDGADRDNGSGNGGEVKVIDLASGEKIPEEILAALSDDKVTKWAYNAAFERICLSAWLRRNYPQYLRTYSISGDPVQRYLDPSSWKCTMVWAAYNGLPLSLEKVGAVLGFEEQKLKEGKELIKYFCCPCKPTKTNGGRTWNLPEHAPEKWELFKKYNARDVQVELQIQERLRTYPVPDAVWDEYRLDQEINDRGIMVDRAFVDKALEIDELSKTDLTARMQEKTGLANPNSVVQMKDYLNKNGMDVESLGKKEVSAMIETAPEPLAEVLSLRLQLAKSSVKKYQAMQNAVCEDSRCHGMFQFYGANRTGRWCLTGDHEVLTPEGWKRLDEWRGGEIACWNAQTEAVSFQNAEQVSFSYDGPMYTYKDSRIDQCSTPEHKMYVRSGDSWQDMTVEEMSKCSPCIPTVRTGSYATNYVVDLQNAHEIMCKPTVSSFHGTVYCAVTQTGYFLVRRNGKVWITGNSGRIVQMQNLPKNYMPDLEQARELVKLGDYEMLSMLYDSVPGVLSELIRTAFIPRPGYKFIVCDFSAIEARVLSHLAGEKWRIDVFHSGRDIYCESASRMFGVPVEKNGVNAELRSKGKIAELALGYGGSSGALKAMGALEQGLKEEELQPLVDMWRASNPKIVEYWWAVDNAVKTAVKKRTPEKVGDISFIVQSGMLFITLPSGRKLAYVRPRIGMNKFGGESVTYMGVDAQKKWSRVESYGSKFVENLVQSVSRDILAYAMQTLRNCFICGSVHDELIIECDPRVSLNAVCELMSKTPPWLLGIELRADGYECAFYQKR